MSDFFFFTCLSCFIYEVKWKQCFENITVQSCLFLLKPLTVIDSVKLTI